MLELRIRAFAASLAWASSAAADTAVSAAVAASPAASTNCRAPTDGRLFVPAPPGGAGGPVRPPRGTISPLAGLADLARLERLEGPAQRRRFRRAWRRRCRPVPGRARGRGWFGRWLTVSRWPCRQTAQPPGSFTGPCVPRGHSPLPLRSGGLRRHSRTRDTSAVDGRGSGSRAWRSDTSCCT